ncbi:MAG: ribosomal RNA small subunit methyltransferase A [Spirochaetales bacterium]|nr:ribosomal RNA small subunit methyltransferase A [Spirochaetales bacterium]
MQPIDHDSPRAIKRLLNERNLTVKKRFGQNFLINRGARHKIIDALECENGDLVWEVGPGIGSLTDLLLTKEIRLITFEIDYGFAGVLGEHFQNRGNFELVTGDFINTWQNVAQRVGYPDKIVGNLPYRCAAAIILSLFRHGNNALRAVFTVQKEVALRMTALPGTHLYSSFSALCRLKWSITNIGDLHAGSFFPPPRVISTILVLEAKTPPPSNPRLVMLITRGIFANRRKTVKNNLIRFLEEQGVSPHLCGEILDLTGVRGDSRPETLTEEHILSLVGVLSGILPSS